MKNWLLVAILLTAIGLEGCAGRKVMNPTTGEQMIMLTLADAPGSPSQPVPADMPPDKVNISLPLYPGATPTKRPFRSPFEFIPVSPYLKVARARYQLPEPPEAAMTWYRQQMQASGFSESGAGSNSEQGVVVATGIEFVSQQDSHLHVILSFENDQGQRSLLQYLVTFIAVPPRPAGSIIPAATLRVEVLYRLPQPQAPIQRTITDPEVLGRLTQQINRLERDTRGVHGCLADIWGESELTFVFQNGETKPVRFRPACGNVQVGDVLLFDGQGQVDRAVATAIGSTTNP